MLQKIILLLLCALVVSSGSSAAQSQCKITYPNRSGVTGADVVVTIASTAVIAPKTALCGALVTNTSATNALRCRQTTAPTATTGFKILPYQVVSLGQEAQLGLLCIRDTTATGDISVSVLEYEP